MIFITQLVILGLETVSKSPWDAVLFAPLFYTFFHTLSLDVLPISTNQQPVISPSLLNARATICGFAALIQAKNLICNPLPFKRNSS